MVWPLLLLQVIAYFAGLHASGMWRPTLVVAPATVLRQWMTELRTWWVMQRGVLLSLSIVPQRTGQAQHMDLHRMMVPAVGAGGLNSAQLLQLCVCVRVFIGTERCSPASPNGTVL